MAYTLGIDVGTTFTAAALWRDGRAEAIDLGDHAWTVPSVLFLRDNGEWLVGEAANVRAVTEPGRVAREFKRRVGDEVPLLLGGQQVTAEALTGRMIGWVAEQVTRREGGPPAQVSLTYPANWNDYRRGLMVEAAASAGLGDVELLTEPVAAAIWYASQERLEPGATIGVYDLGGGTFDATVLRRSGDGFELLGQPGGDEQLGGIDFDQAVLDHVTAALGEPWQVLDVADPAVLSAVAQLRAYVVEAKETLSTDVETGIPVILPSLIRHVRLTRAELEEMIREPILHTMDAFRQAVHSAGVAPRDLRGVLLVGGSSRIPLVAELIAGEVGVPVTVDAHPKLAVCLGAAVAAAPQAAANLGQGSGVASRVLAAPDPWVPAAPRVPAAGPVPATAVSPADLLVPPDLEPEAPWQPAAGPAPDAGATVPDLAPTAVVDAPTQPGAEVPAAATSNVGGVAEGPPPQVERQVTSAGADRSGFGRLPWLRRPVWVGAGAGLLLLAGLLVAWVVVRGGSAPAWTAARIADLPTEMESPGVAAFQDAIWAVGGLGLLEGSSQPATREVFVYDPAAGRWDAGPSLPAPVSHAAVVSTGTELFVVGGWDNALRAVPTVLRLDVAARRWVAVPPLPAPRGAGAAAWDGGRIVFGGGTTSGRGGEAQGDVWALEDGRWVEIGQLGTPREHLAAASDGNGTVWFLGGRDSDRQPLDAVDEVTAEGVRPVALQISASEGHGAVWWPQVGLCMIGGRGTGPAGEPVLRAAVECPNGDKGADLSALTVPRTGLGAAVLDGDIYAVGGYSEGTTSSAVAEVFRAAGTPPP